jgi:hypothetical protein
MNNFEKLKKCRKDRYHWLKELSKYIYKEKDWKYLFEDAIKTITEAEKYFKKAIRYSNNAETDFLLKTGYRLLGIGCELFFKSLLLKEKYSINELKEKRKKQISEKIIRLENGSGKLSNNTISLNVIFDLENIKKLNIDFSKFDNFIDKKNKQMIERQKKISQKNKTYTPEKYPAEQTDSKGLLEFILGIRNNLIHSSKLPLHLLFEYENVIKLIKYICKEKNIKWKRDVFDEFIERMNKI